MTDESKPELTRLDLVLARIEAISAQAEPYRALPEDDIRRDKLQRMIDQINTLRREEAFLRTGYVERLAPGGQKMPQHLVELQNMADQGIDPRVPPGTSMNQARTLHLPKKA